MSRGIPLLGGGSVSGGPWWEKRTLVPGTSWYCQGSKGWICPPRSGCGNYLLPTPAKVPAITAVITAILPFFLLLAGALAEMDALARTALSPAGKTDSSLAKRSMGGCKLDQALVSLVMISVVHGPVSHGAKYGCEVPVGPRGESCHFREGKSCGCSLLGCLTFLSQLDWLPPATTPRGVC